MFCFFVLSFNKIKVRDLKIFGLLIILMISAIYVSKNHDDFPYYHLTYALNLSENGFLIGMDHLVMDLEHHHLFFIFIHYFSYQA